ncbi:leucine--tRNA ligase [Candidatus Berkelbacteria bacterium]|nr:leucine--tRNA ligase [Candidatus Berkelbacteria bacterium]
MDRYDHRAIERKWQTEWQRCTLYKTTDAPKQKYYCLDMFPYPSGAGLHVGHPLGYTATDIISRKRRAEGYDVLHPMGWDAFGLPAENYAINNGTPPAETTAASIQRFKTQLKAFGFSYDWDRELDSSSPAYYRWTQWIFLQLYKNGLAYQKEAPVNWCPNDQTVLANEQVIDGCCERCGTSVLQKSLRQWFFKITKYADELLQMIDQLDWPEPIKRMQRNWIGRSEGVMVQFPVADADGVIEVFTTRIDTIFSGTFLVLAPEHPLLDQLRLSIRNWSDVSAYRASVTGRTERDRLAESQSKTGVELVGIQVRNPASGAPMPVWIADFVLGSYGTGAVFANAHDARDFAFAKEHSIPLITSLNPVDGRDDAAIQALQVCFTGDGILHHSGQFDGLTSAEARPAISQWLIARQVATRVTQYKLRDWLVSRQRYWGAPIPIIHCQTCGAVPVPEDQLPVLLPTDVDFRPTGESPIARSPSFHDGVTCPHCQSPARRESDTMDTFVDSSWYFLRFADPHTDQAPFDVNAIQQWLPVDLYVGGAEHAVLHLLYARFMTKALDDCLSLGFREPFVALRNQGLILADDGRKMSKSLGNVINPDELIDQYGADSLRCYEMFMGPFCDVKPWNTQSLIGMRRWLDRIWQLQGLMTDDREPQPETLRLIEHTVRQVSSDIEHEKFNTALSALMILTNQLRSDSMVTRSDFHRVLQLLAPFAPHLAQELYERTGGTGFIDIVSWPQADLTQLVIQTTTLPVTIDGKLRATLAVSIELDQATALARANQNPAIVKYLTGRTVRNVVYVPGKILNLVTSQASE